MKTDLAGSRGESGEDTADAAREDNPRGETQRRGGKYY